jgi:hypothetical protein
VQRLERLKLAAEVSDVPDVSRLEIAVGARHRFSLEDAFGRKNSPSKRSIDGFYAILLWQNKNFPWSNP